VADLIAFIQLAGQTQRNLNLKTVAQLNEMLADDRTGMVMAALEQRARFEDTARTEYPHSEWDRGRMVAALEWALPWPGDK
jgi:hypothetical protein